MSAALARALRRATIIALSLVAVALLAAACGGDDSSSSDSSKSSKSSSGGDSSSDDSGRFCEDGTSEEAVAKRADAFDDAPTGTLDGDTTYTVKVKTSEGDFDIKLDPKAGPIAAANFAFLVRNCFYDGVVFHRLIKGFMVQTGDPTGTGMGGPGYAIDDDEIDGTYDKGIVAMANAGPNTGGSQFFIVQGDAVQLPPNYAIFGTVDAAGMKTIDAIAETPVETSDNGEESKPTKTVKIESAQLEES